jgi:hypothetical protein
MAASRGTAVTPDGGPVHFAQHAREIGLMGPRHDATGKAFGVTDEESARSALSACRHWSDLRTSMNEGGHATGAPVDRIDKQCAPATFTRTICENAGGAAPQTLQPEYGASLRCVAATPHTVPRPSPTPFKRAASAGVLRRATQGRRKPKCKLGAQGRCDSNGIQKKRAATLRGTA